MAHHAKAHGTAYKNRYVVGFLLPILLNTVKYCRKMYRKNIVSQEKYRKNIVAISARPAAA
jgi:hypothetical protein